MPAFQDGNTTVFPSAAQKQKGHLSNKIIGLMVSQGHILHDPNILINHPT